MITRYIFRRSILRKKGREIRQAVGDFVLIILIVNQLLCLAYAPPRFTINPVFHKNVHRERKKNYSKILISDYIIGPIDEMDNSLI